MDGPGKADDAAEADGTTRGRPRQNEAVRGSAHTGERWSLDVDHELTEMR